MRKKERQNNITTFSTVVIAIIALSSLAFIGDLTSDQTYIANTSDAVIKQEEEKFEEKVKYVRTPDQVKAIYMSACVAASPNFRDNLVKLIEETELNSLVIDIKDYTGTISFNSSLEGDNGEGCRTNDMEEFITRLHDLGIYVIGRITVFQDPLYSNLYPETAVKKESDGSVWRDHKGLSFVEVGAEKYWEYVLELAKISHGIGFDEINFDYVRFPSDGNMKDIYFPFSNDLIDNDDQFGKAKALEKFFSYLYHEIEKYNKDKEYPMITSADLFGMTTTNTDDLNIGQVLERALPYFDYIAPMVYPSHYPDGFNGWADPNLVVYDLIHYVMDSGVERVKKFDSATSTPQDVKDRVDVLQLRTWIQDFDYGGNYGPKEVRDQIQATYDVGLNSWMIWAPSNIYTREALKDEEEI